MSCKANCGGGRCTFFGCTKGSKVTTPLCKGHGNGKTCTKSVHGGTLYRVSHAGGKRCALPECTETASCHGGGKKCKVEGCPKKSAHGGGCLWGQAGLEFGVIRAVLYEKLTRKSGLCAAHSTQVPEGACVQDLSSCAQMEGGYSPGSVEHGSTSYVQQFSLLPIILRNACLEGFSLPEGRVYGGGLMARLRGVVFGMSCDMEEGVNEVEVEISVLMPPHKWV